MSIEPVPVPTPTEPAETDNSVIVKDIALKTFWTAVFTGFGLVTVALADLEPAYALLAASAANIVGAWLRSKAGAYAPPPAEEVQSRTVATAIETVRR